MSKCKNNGKNTQRQAKCRSGKHSTQEMHGSNIKLGAWNIQGLQNSIDDSLFKDFVYENDIIILSETWLSEKQAVFDKDFYNYHSLRQKHSKAKRPSGGLSVLIRNSLRKGNNGSQCIKFVKENEYTVWFKLCKEHFGIEFDIFIGAVYIPPEQSTIYKNNESDPFQLLEDDLLRFNSMGEIIILGDFNARTSSLSDCTDINLTDDLQVDDSLNQSSILEKMGRSDRINCDNKVNSFGRKLIELCKCANLKILNGRTIGDINGDYTCFQYNGKSVVDYCICSEKLVPLMPIFKVSSPNHVSDHSSIETTLIIRKSKVSKPCKTYIEKCIEQFRWNNDSCEVYQNILSLPAFQMRIQQFLNNNDKDVNSCLEELHKIYIDAAKLCLKLKKKNKDKNSNTSNKLGFDGECRRLKNSVLHLGKQVSKFPKDPILYGKFITTKKAFKKLVKQKNLETKNRILDQICLSERQNPKLFWNLINKLRKAKKCNDSPIDMDTWHSHFNRLHNISIAENQDTVFRNKISKLTNDALKQENFVKLLDSPFSLDEINKVTKLLKSGKAGGPDQILNEMLIAALPSLSPCLCKMFNLILSSESMPLSWSYGYLVPIFKKGDRLDPGNYRGISIVSCINKLFSKLLNSRLTDFLDIKQHMSRYQIGFARKKRTADHIFVLKCIIEEAKYNKQAIFSCFVDLKKAFDTVWREGLFYKLLHQYNISTKFVRILNNMYSDLHGFVKINGSQSQTIPLSIGLRQGCNLSPFLFNLYINDLPNILEKAQCDPVDLNKKPVNILMYADDMLLLSKSEAGLIRALSVLKTYCKKWQLVVNVDKTKIVVFNKPSFKKKSLPYNEQDIEVVKEYTYLGIKISNSGSFTKAIKALHNSALRAYFSIKSICYQNAYCKPRTMVKLFDSMVKPILLYGSEIWGAFDIKRNNIQDLLPSLMLNDKYQPEKLNLKMCKQTLRIPRSASNIASRAELGRLPVMKSIIVAFCKYFTRLHSFKDRDLLHDALKSQENLTKYSEKLKHLTFIEVANLVIDDLKLSMPQETTETSICNFAGKIKNALIDKYKDHFNWYLSQIRETGETKLAMYAHVKGSFTYENYLDNCKDYSSLVRFRTSCHYLPIERGRYCRPVIPRNLRKCNLCNVAVGNEYHSMFNCTNETLVDLRGKHLSKIADLSSQITTLSNESKFIYVLSGNDLSITSTVCSWVNGINQTYKDANK